MKNTLSEIKEFIFINYVNKDHYQLLTPNLEYIKNRILKKTTIKYYIIKFDIVNNKIIDLCNDSINILEDKIYFKRFEKFN